MDPCATVIDGQHRLPARRCSLPACVCSVMSGVRGALALRRSLGLQKHPATCRTPAPEWRTPGPMRRLTWKSSGWTATDCQPVIHRMTWAARRSSADAGVRSSLIERTMPWHIPGQRAPGNGVALGRPQRHDRPAAIYWRLPSHLPTARQACWMPRCRVKGFEQRLIRTRGEHRRRSGYRAPAHPLPGGSPRYRRSCARGPRPRMARNAG